jgi:hypothetical protein
MEREVEVEVLFQSGGTTEKVLRESPPMGVPTKYRAPGKNCEDLRLDGTSLHSASDC